MPEPYPHFPQDLATAKTLKTELDFAIHKAKETGKTQAAEILLQKNQEYCGQMEEKLWPFEQILPKKELKDEYDFQKESFARNNILEPLPNGELGITGIDQKIYPFPKLEDIQQELQKDQELREKMEQGLIEINITPFALPLAKLTETLTQAIKRIGKGGG